MMSAHRTTSASAAGGVQPQRACATRATSPVHDGAAGSKNKVASGAATRASYTARRLGGWNAVRW